MKKIRLGTLSQPKVGHEGFGDTLYWIFKYTGISWIVNKLFKDCGCDKRRIWLNKLFKYKKIN